MNSTKLQKQDYIEMFNEALEAGVAKFVEAARIYVKAIDEDAAWRLKFYQAQPKISWHIIEEVGRGTMHPELMLESSTANITAIRRLPMSMQREIVEGKKYDLLTEGNDVLKVDLRQLTTGQRKQMFNGSSLRTLAEQKTWREANRPLATENPLDTMPYIIKGNKVYFRKGTVLSKVEIKNLLMEI